MSESRPVCVHALAGLRRNTTRLTVVMCIGIGLALFGIYVQTRRHSNPEYMPTISVASHWLYNSLGQRIIHPGSLFNGCLGSGGANNKYQSHMSSGALLMSHFIHPLTRYSGLMNGFINLIQIVLLKVRCKSLGATDATIGLSIAGLVISGICLIGSLAHCKLMCISCLGIHHAVIIYLAYRRRHILKNILCPIGNGNDSGKGSTTTTTTGGSSSNNTSTSARLRASISKAGACSFTTGSGSTLQNRRRE